MDFSYLLVSAPYVGYVLSNFSSVPQTLKIRVCSYFTIIVFKCFLDYWLACELMSSENLCGTINAVIMIQVSSSKRILNKNFKICKDI